MHVLLTNDDGVHAQGLEALQNAVLRLGATCTVVAPAIEQSMCGHRVTTHSPLKLEQLEEDRYAVHGTPADCVRIALFGLHLKPDWVLSGINHGGNMGQDLHISGTVAAAREATYHGVKAMALSHYIVSGVGFDWERTSRWAELMLRSLVETTLHPGEYWNINFPHHPPGVFALPEVHHVQPARSPLNVAFRNEGDAFHYTARYAERPKDEGSDVAACFDGMVSVSRLRL
jgi:5'-nucleotidase